MKEDLLKEIYRQVDLNEKALPIVSLELFFEGNDDTGSIGCNLLEHPGTEKFYSILKKIRDRENVQDVLIEIMEFDEDESMWPFSERVYIITSASKNEIRDWVEELEIDEIGKGYEYCKPVEAPVQKEGYHVYSLWWD